MCGDAVLEAGSDLIGMQCVCHEVLEECSLICLLVGLIESKIGVVLLGWHTAIETNTSSGALLTSRSAIAVQ